jgi:uncharacterized membrane protein
VIPEPLHPAVVHFPIALAMLAPIVSLLAWLAIRGGWIPARAWWVVVGLQVLIALTGWLASEAGEREEDRVERVVAERYIEEHEEAAERFLFLAAFAVPLAAAGLLSGRRGAIARVASFVATLLVAAAVGSAGRQGGELVYHHGAARAYVDADTAGAVRGGGWEHEEEDDDD